MIVELFNCAGVAMGLDKGCQLVLQTTALAFSFSANKDLGFVELQEGSSLDDEYIAMEIHINGRKEGCVYDYSGPSKSLVYGECLGRDNEEAG